MAHILYAAVNHKFVLTGWLFFTFKIRNGLLLDVSIFQ